MATRPLPNHDDPIEIEVDGPQAGPR